MGFIENSNKELDFDDKDWFTLPGFNPFLDYRLFKIEGEGAAPLLCPGDVVVCQPQGSFRKLRPGSPVIVVTQKGILMKNFVKVGKGTVFLQNENKEFPQQSELGLDAIKQVFSIHGKVTTKVVSHHRIISSTRIKEIEETLKFLKKEILELSHNVESMYGGKLV